jgi:hypothetical protein
MSSVKETKGRPSLSVLALTSFIISFAVSRVFTTISPATVVVRGGLHIHHFWYGLILLAIGGWLGISYNDVKIDRLAAILFGAGGGLIADEAGLLLTLRSENYWAEITYTFVIAFVAFLSILILIFRYHGVIHREFAEFLNRNASLYFGLFLATVSMAFVIGADNILVVTGSSVMAVTGCILILAYFVRRFWAKH